MSFETTFGTLISSCNIARLPKYRNSLFTFITKNYHKTSGACRKHKTKSIMCPARLHIPLRSLETLREFLSSRFRRQPVMCIQRYHDVRDQWFDSSHTLTLTILWIWWLFTNAALTDSIGYHEHLTGGHWDGKRKIMLTHVFAMGILLILCNFLKHDKFTV